METLSKLLTSKAIAEIEKNVGNVEDYRDKNDAILVAIGLVFSLFDLKHYPITYADIFNYLRDHGSYEDNYCNGKESTEDDFYFTAKNACNPIVYIKGYNNDSIELMILKIANVLKKDQLVVIGEINGFLEY